MVSSKPVALLQERNRLIGYSSPLVISSDGSSESKGWAEAKCLTAIAEPTLLRAQGDTRWWAPCLCEVGLDQPAALLHIARALHPLGKRAEELPPQRRHRQKDQRPAPVERVGGF